MQGPPQIPLRAGDEAGGLSWSRPPLTTDPWLGKSLGTASPPGTIADDLARGRTDNPWRPIGYGEEASLSELEGLDVDSAARARFRRVPKEVRKEIAAKARGRRLGNPSAWLMKEVSLWEHGPEPRPPHDTSRGPPPARADHHGSHCRAPSPFAPPRGRAASPPAAYAAQGRACTPPPASETCSSAGPTSSATTQSGTAPETSWRRLKDPFDRYYWKHSVTKESFYESGDDTRGWQQYQTEAGQFWWGLEGTERHFFEQPRAPVRQAGAAQAVGAASADMLNAVRETVHHLVAELQDVADERARLDAREKRLKERVAELERLLSVGGGAP